MSESMHTPGPWRLGEIHDGFVEIDADIHTSLARVVWQMRDDADIGCRSPRQEANARLIAAAPDMLAALEAVANAAVLYLRAKSGDGECSIPLSVVEKVEAALALLRPQQETANG